MNKTRLRLLPGKVFNWLEKPGPSKTDRPRYACTSGFGLNLERIWAEEACQREADDWVLKQAEAGVPLAEVIRKVGISEQTFYRWESKYAGLEVDQVRQMAQLQEEI